MPELTYTTLRVAKGATLLECDSCGAVVFHWTTHEAWHKLYDLLVADVKGEPDHCETFGGSLCPASWGFACICKRG